MLKCMLASGIHYDAPTRLFPIIFTSRSAWKNKPKSMFFYILFGFYNFTLKLMVAQLFARVFYHENIQTAQIDSIILVKVVYP